MWAVFTTLIAFLFDGIWIYAFIETAGQDGHEANGYFGLFSILAIIFSIPMVVFWGILYNQAQKKKNEQ